MQRWLGVVACGLMACDPAPAADTDAGSSSGASESAGSTTDAVASTGSTSLDSTSGSSTGPIPSTGAADESSTGAPIDCDGFVPGEAFEIAAGSSSTRIHPHVAGDGSGAWFTFVQPEPAGSLFDVMATRLRCAGVADVEPFTVNTEPSNDIDGSIAVSGDRVMVLWNSDDGSGGSSNLQVHARTFFTDGTPLDDAQRRITTAVDGEDILQNHTFGVVTPAPEGFVVAGLRAHPDSPAFVAFSQALDLDGALVDEAFGPPVEDGVSHLLASATGPWLAFGRSSDRTDAVWMTDGTEEGTQPLFDGQSGQGAHVLTLPAAPEQPLIAAAVGQGSSFDIAIAVGAGSPLLLGEASSLEHNPTLAAGPDGQLAVVYHRNLGGLNNAVVLQRLALRGESVVTVGEPEELDVMSPPYPPSLTWIEAGWLATWSRGSSPDFTTWGRVLNADAR
ncbi:MAG: hypothetical protein AAGA54_15110 [Myxococcota bacterium]